VRKKSKIIERRAIGYEMYVRQSQKNSQKLLSVGLLAMRCTCADRSIAKKLPKRIDIKIESCYTILYTRTKKILKNL
jgi:hypothetical protein